MPIIPLVIVLILVGVALYLINTLIPMDARIKTLINVVIVVVACLYVLDAFGVTGTHLRWR